MKKTYHGSCHCKAVTFTARVDLSSGTGKCNCRLCWKQRMWKTNRVDIEDFTLHAEPGSLGGFMGRHQGSHHFCRDCGISTHTHVVRPEAGEEYVMIQVATFDDMPIEELLAAPLRIVDGRHDEWTTTPAETRHL
ncbi:MAG: GFA family protein [Sphingobium sp.]